MSVLYAGNREETDLYLAEREKEGYQYLRTDAPEEKLNEEYEKVVMVLDASFYYDDNRYLRQMKHSPGEFGVSILFCGLNRGKKKICLIVQENEPVFGQILSLLQGREENNI